MSIFEEWRKGLCVGLVGLSLVLVGCSSSSTYGQNASSGSAGETAVDDGQDRVVTDQDGNKVTIPGNLQRVAPATGPLTQIVGMLGDADKVSVTIQGIDPLFFKAWPQLGTEVGDPKDVNELTRTQTQVVFGPEFSDDERSQMQAEGVVAFVVKDFSTPQQVVDSVNLIGDVLGGGARERAKSYADYTAKTLTDVESLASKVSDRDKLKVLVLRYAADGYTAVGTDELAASYIENAGGKAVGEKSNSAVSAKQIARWAPDAIITISDKVQEKITADPELADVPAVKNKRVYAEPHGTYPWSTASAESILFPYFVGSVLYPDQFSDVDLSKTVKDFYADHYNCTLSDDDLKDILGD